MSVWLLASLALVVALAGCGIAVLRGRPVDRLVAVETSAGIETLALLVLAEAFGRPAFFDLAVTAALLSFAGALAFARFFERWL